jgi:hypothetical protein
MPVGALLDTSFLITLAGRDRANHQAAKRYWKYFLENRIPLFLSTIVVSEFSVKQALGPEILRHCVVLPFNYQDALRSAELHRLRYSAAGISRDALKDDLKLIAQAEIAQAGFLITDDSDTMFRFVEHLRAAEAVSIKAIKLEDGFDSSIFNGGQRDFDAQLGDPETGD